MSEDVLGTLDRARKALKIMRSIRDLDDETRPAYEGLSLQARAGADLIRERVADPEERYVVVEHYLRGRTWREVATSLDVSESHVYRVKTHAIKALTAEED